VNLKDSTRQALFQAALRLIRATQYRNAGTLEFLVDPSENGENFYFLEMNTRLQVEHPVSEMITGIDLVRAQLELAIHNRMDQIAQIGQSRGHAIEVRLYAEDPAQGFIPTPGPVEYLKWPTGYGIRVESGIEEGQSIGTQFDSMLGKLIVYGETRGQALARMKYALKETVILGLGTNQNYLRAIANHPLVKSGQMDTGLLEREFSDYKPEPSEEDLILLQKAKQDGIARTGSFGIFDESEETLPSPWAKEGAL
jgi:acetyl-CoA/propionyl-CoA carboxylase biotin carboxyl carrier protein